MEPLDDDDASSTPNATAAAALEYLVPSWLAESKSAHHFWSCLVQPLYEPITNRALPAVATLPLICLVVVLLLLWTTTAGEDDEQHQQHPAAARLRKRRARAKKRRRALWARLRSLPAYSILFAYVATGPCAVACADCVCVGAVRV